MIESHLGEGGLAVVYKVRHARLGTLHAMKVLKIPHVSIQERLLQEGQVQARIQHPNIVSVTDVIDVDGAPGLIMEYIEGSNLDQLLADQRLSLEQVDHLAVGILEGVRAAHDLGLIHRDLKPANILLSVKDRQITPKITDFGLAKLMTGEGGGGSTRSGMTMGTPSYMPPEQIRSARDVDERADVFALGAILYELCTGQRAYGGDDVLKIFNDIAGGVRVPARELRPDLPARMQRAIDGALAVSLDDRLPDVATLLDVWTGEKTAGIKAVESPFASEVFTRVRQLGAAGSSLQKAEVTSQPTMDTSVVPVVPVSAPTSVDLLTDDTLAPRRSAPLGLLGRLGILLALGLVVLGAAGAGLLAGGGLLALVTLEGPPVVVVPDPVPEPAPEPVPEPVAPAPVPEPPPKPVRPKPVRPKPVRPAPTSTPVPAAATGKLVVIGGQATLSRDGRQYRTFDALEAGTYGYHVLPEQGEPMTGVVTIRPGRTIRLDCDPRLAICTEK
ncbi:MAG: serine/threonine protein kinase [Myxococcales bacterium]|nr:serine/threonine protein kinase [Myxococcales bacterium]